ncbi:MAG: peptidylprolyl isomerase, partial [Patescibacteria group bacterium]
MYKKNRRNFIYVLVFTLVMAVIALPLEKYLPKEMQSSFENIAINLGLDLQGGLHLEYVLDLDKVPSENVDDAKDAVQAAAERKVNAYGVGEPVVWLSERGGDTFMTVEIPGVDNSEEVKNVVQKAPFLQFKTEKTQEEIEADQKQLEEDLAEMINPMNADAKEVAVGVLERAKNGEDFGELAKEFSKDPSGQENGGEFDFVKKGEFIPEFDAVLFSDDVNDGDVYGELVETDFGWHIIKKTMSVGEGDDKEVSGQQILFAKMQVPQVDQYKPTELTGELLDNAMADYSSSMGTSEPQVNLTFNKEGSEMFAQITKDNLGKTVAIYVDDEIVSAPTVQSEIVDGHAVISGSFDIEEAKDLARRLNEGALPVPFELVSQQSVEATLGAEALEKGMKAGMVGLVLVMIYMIFYYRFFGVIASIALGIYAAIIVSIGIALSYYVEFQPNFIYVNAGEPVKVGPVKYIVEYIGEHDGDEKTRPKNTFFQISIIAENEGKEETRMSGGQFYILDKDDKKIQPVYGNFSENDLLNDLLEPKIPVSFTTQFDIT